MMAKSLEGTQLGRYELAEIVGRGGLATVYKAYQRNLKRWVAVKVLHTSSDETKARFKREAKAVARLRHRNILIVYEFSEDKGWPYMAMELVEGGSLAQLLSGNPLPWGRVASLAISLAEALHYAHQQGLIHRDVKPSNILMAQPNVPLLADFGLVKVQDSQQLTLTGMVIGTPSYIAPELAKGEQSDNRVDIYSLGVIIFEMITGRLPFIHKKLSRMLLAHVNDPVPSPREINPACPPALEQIIFKAMEKSPADRYSTMQEMIKQIREAVGNSTLDMFDPDVPTAFIKRSARSGSSVKPAGGTPIYTNQPRLVLIESNRTLLLPEPDPTGDGLIIGRTHHNKTVDIDLGPYGAIKGGVSRRHARLFKKEEVWFVDDLHSLNKTYLNDEKLVAAKPLRLKHGDVIRCGLLAFTFLLT